MNSKGKLQINIISFGYKYGLPDEANFLQDVRFLPNPYYDDNLKSKSGLDKCVRDYVKNTAQSREYILKLMEFASLYASRSFETERDAITFAIGCTGGRHRSVTVAEELYAHLKDCGYRVSVYHRDINKDE